nr:chalcone--flavonone isomerase [Tanacetum cinerariifolium]
MAKLHSSIGIELESIFVPPYFKPPSATKTLFLIGAEEKAIESLARKWKGKTNVELMDSEEFYNEIYNGNPSLSLCLSIRLSITIFLVNKY